MFQYNTLKFRGHVVLIIILNTSTGNMGFPSQYTDCATGGTIQGSNPVSGKGFFFKKKIKA